MACEVIWADAAREDLEAAAADIHRNSPFYATAFVKRTLTAALALSDFPLLCSSDHFLGAKAIGPED